MPRLYSKPRISTDRRKHTAGRGYVSNDSNGTFFGIKMARSTLPVVSMRPKDGGHGLQINGNDGPDHDPVFSDYISDKARDQVPDHDWSWYVDPRNVINEGLRNGKLNEVLGGFMIGAAEACFIAGLACLAAAGISAATAAAVVGTAEGVELTGLLGRAALAAEEGGAVSNTFQSAIDELVPLLRNRGGFSYRV